MTDPEWLISFREWSSKSGASQFPSRQEEQEAETAFHAGYDASLESTEFCDDPIHKTQGFWFD